LLRHFASRSAPHHPGPIQPRRGVPGRRQRYRPALEGLETRQLLSISNQLLVSQLYADLLGRGAVPAEMTAWGGLLDSGFSPYQVAQVIVASPEYHTRFVQDLYLRLLHRPAEEPALLASVRYLNAGGSDEFLEAILAGSQEYILTRGDGNSGGMLNALSEDFLGQPLDAQVGQTYFPLFQQGLSLTQIASAVLTSPAARQYLVRGDYQLLLHREAEATGLNGWVAALAAGMPDEMVLAGIAGSPEYQFKATFGGVNRAVTTDAGVQQMPSVAVDPRDSLHAVMAYMDYSLVNTGYAGIGVAVSHDAGTTWQHTSVPLPAGFDQGAANPIVRFDDQSQVFVSFMAATFLGPKAPLTNAGFQDRGLPGVQSNNGLFVAHSDDGGLSWQPPVAVVSHLYDGQHQVFFEVIPDLAIDTFRTLPNGQPNPNHGNQYVVWTRIYPAGQFPGQPDPNGGTGTDIMIAVSKDGGQSWITQVQDPSGLAARGEITLEAASTTPVTVLQDPANNNTNAVGVGPVDQAHVTIGPEGDIYVSNFSGGDFGVLHSIDDGASFLAPDHQTGRGIAFGIGDTAFMGSLLTNQFRTSAMRAIVADPTRPGYLYAAEPIAIVDASGSTIDPADVFFARSTDYGQHWTTTFQVGPNPATSVLNDDNGGNKAANHPDDVISGQAMARLAVDAQGDIAVIWYDTRRDPQNHLLDVFGTVSTDGGLSFSANFRLTDTSFDANRGAFTDATGSTNYYLGDFIGLSLANNTGYATWTDTRNGNQDIYSTRFPLSPAPAPSNDRFEPNDTAPTATDLGPPVVQRFFPKLAVPAGDQDWFRLQAAATGDLTVTALQAEPGKNLQLELWDETGTTLLARGADLAANGSVTGQQVIFPGSSGRTYLVRVVPLPTGGSGPNGYSLQVQSLTADLGTAVHGFKDGTLGPGDQAYYLLKAPASGSLEVKLTPGADVHGTLNLEVVDPSTLSLLASASPASGGSEQVSLPVSGGQAVLLHVSGVADAHGSFTLEFTNLDQFTTAQNASLLFPAGAGPSQVALGHLRGPDKPLDMVVANAGSNTISVLLGNGDGTFQAPRQFAVGAFRTPNPATNGRFPTFRRDVAIADLNGDLIPDVVVTNYDSGDVSVLLGRGDGTFEPQRRFDATAGPFALAVGDLNGDGIPDLAVVDATSPLVVTVAALLGRGDGTFLPERTFQIRFVSADNFPYSAIRIADLNGDGKGDLIISGATNPHRVFVYLSNGDGTFRPVIDPADGQTGFPAGGLGAGLAVGDVNGDGKLDIVNTSLEAGAIDVLLGNGDGTFQPLENFNYVPIPHQDFTAGQSPLAVALADVATSVLNSDGSTTSTLGKPDGHPDLIVAASGVVLTLKSVGPPGVFVLPAIWSGNSFIGFDAPQLLAAGEAPQDVKVGDLNGDGVPDVAVVDRDGVRVTFGKRPPLVPGDPNLGTVVHVVEPTLTIVPGHEEEDYTLTVPTEAAHGAGDEVLDFSGFFQAQEGAGISMEVRDAAGHLLGAGERFRVVAHQGQQLTLHVFGVTAADGQRGSGAYTLDIDVLPQVVSVEAQPLLPGVGGNPGGPTASLVVTLQGDRLDPAAAEDPANYTVTWAGPDGLFGTADDQAIPLAAGPSAVYDPSANVDVASGTTYPTAVRQTVTLLFDQPLPAGSYQVTLAPAIQTAAFNADEAGLLSGGTAFAGHPVVRLANGQVVNGSLITALDLVHAAGALGSLDVFKQGTPFLTQLHDDLAALLDSALTQLGDAPTITAALTGQVQQRFDPALGQAGQRPTGALVLVLDPVGISSLTDQQNNQVSYDLQDNTLTNTFDNGFVDVVGNLEVVVIPTGGGTFTLSVNNVPASARGGVVFAGLSGDQVVSLTDQLRSGQSVFNLSF
jgi:hypothetical protein